MAVPRSPLHSNSTNSLIATAPTAPSNSSPSSPQPPASTFTKSSSATRPVVGANNDAVLGTDYQSITIADDSPLVSPLLARRAATGTEASATPRGGGPAGSERSRLQVVTSFNEGQQPNFEKLTASGASSRSSTNVRSAPYPPSANSSSVMFSQSASPKSAQGYDASNFHRQISSASQHSSQQAWLLKSPMRSTSVPDTPTFQSSDVQDSGSKRQGSSKDLVSPSSGATPVPLHINTIPEQRNAVASAYQPSKYPPQSPKQPSAVHSAGEEPSSSSASSYTQPHHFSQSSTSHTPRSPQLKEERDKKVLNLEVAAERSNSTQRNNNFPQSQKFHPPPTSQQNARKIPLPSPDNIPSSSKSNNAAQTSLPPGLSISIANAAVFAAVSPVTASSPSPSPAPGMMARRQRIDGNRPDPSITGLRTEISESHAFRKVRSKAELNPTPHAEPRYRRRDPTTGVYISPLRALTVNLVTTYRICNPQFRYENELNPRRVLTKPSKGIKNDGLDNAESDYILYVNDVLGSDEQRYLILDVLGQGTFGQVVKCQNLKTKEIVGVKVVKNKPAYFNQSMTEVSILEQLNDKFDPNDRHHLLRLYDTFVHKRHLCLVFELLSVNLYELIKQNQFRGLSTNLVRVFASQILDALTVLKEARIIHCDLKPENILLKNLESPTIKVIDFGSACHEHQTVFTYIQSRFYRSPEVLLGMPYSAAIDMWSLGCIAAELFLGLPLFPGSSEYNQISRIVEMLGVPPIHMIELGKNAMEFFERASDDPLPNADGPGRDSVGRKYQLKSLEKYSIDRKMDEQPGKKYFAATNLPEIIQTYPVLRKGMNQNDFEREKQSRMAFTDFLEGLLSLNPIKRWSPQQARLHPFITGEKFTGPFFPPMLPSQTRLSSRCASPATSLAQVGPARMTPVENGIRPSISTNLPPENPNQAIDRISRQPPLSAPASSAPSSLLSSPRDIHPTNGKPLTSPKGESFDKSSTSQQSISDPISRPHTPEPNATIPEIQQQPFEMPGALPDDNLGPLPSKKGKEPKLADVPDLEAGTTELRDVPSIYESTDIPGALAQPPSPEAQLPMYNSGITSIGSGQSPSHTRHKSLSASYSQNQLPEAGSSEDRRYSGGSVDWLGITHGNNRSIPTTPNGSQAQDRRKRLSHRHRRRPSGQQYDEHGIPVEIPIVGDSTMENDLSHAMARSSIGPRPYPSTGQPEQQHDHQQRRGGSVQHQGSPMTHTSSLNQLSPRPHSPVQMTSSTSSLNTLQVSSDTDGLPFFDVYPIRKARSQSICVGIPGQSKSQSASVARGHHSSASQGAYGWLGLLGLSGSAAQGGSQVGGHARQESSDFTTGGEGHPRYGYASERGELPNGLPDAINGEEWDAGIPWVTLGDTSPLASDCETGGPYEGRGATNHPRTSSNLASPISALDRSTPPFQNRSVPPPPFAPPMENPANFAMQYASYPPQQQQQQQQHQHHQHHHHHHPQQPPYYHPNLPPLTNYTQNYGPNPPPHEHPFPWTTTTPIGTFAYSPQPHTVNDSNNSSNNNNSNNHHHQYFHNNSIASSSFSSNAQIRSGHHRRSSMFARSVHSMVGFGLSPSPQNAVGGTLPEGRVATSSYPTFATTDSIFPVANREELLPTSSSSARRRRDPRGGSDEV